MGFSPQLYKTMKSLKSYWEISKIRFYIKNTIWNYSFWLFCKKKYKTISYIKQDVKNLKRENVSKKKFEGYLYKGKVYLDNPGLQNIKKSTWKSWKKKNLF